MIIKTLLYHLGYLRLFVALNLIKLILRHFKTWKWGWINDTILIFEQAIPLRETDCKRLTRWWRKGGSDGNADGVYCADGFQSFIFHSSCPLNKMLRLEKKTLLPFLILYLYPTCIHSNSENYLTSPGFCNM